MSNGTLQGATGRKKGGKAAADGKWTSPDPKKLQARNVDLLAQTVQSTNFMQFMKVSQE